MYNLSPGKLVVNQHEYSQQIYCIGTFVAYEQQSNYTTSAYRREKTLDLSFVLGIHHAMVIIIGYQVFWINTYGRDPFKSIIFYLMKPIKNTY